MEAESFAKLHYDLLWWLIILLGGGVIGLLIYIFQDKNSNSHNALVTLEVNLTSAVNALKDSINRLNSTVETLRDDVFGEIDLVKVECHKIDIKVKGIETICRERGKHCPLYKSMVHKHQRDDHIEHFHSRGEDGDEGTEL